MHLIFSRFLGCSAVTTSNSGTFLSPLKQTLYLLTVCPRLPPHLPGPLAACFLSPWVCLLGALHVLGTSVTDFLHSASCLQVHPGVWCVCIGAECGSVAWLGDILFMYSWLGGRVDYFRFLAVRKRAATKIRIQILLRSYVPFFKLKIFFLIHFWLHWVFVATRAFL